MGLGYDSSADAKLSGQISVCKWENIQPGRRNGEVTPSESMQGLRLIWSDPSSSGQWQQPADFDTAISLPACLGRGIRFFVLIFWSPGSLSTSLTSRRKKKENAWKRKERRAIDVRMLCFEVWKKVAENWSVCILFCWRLAWRGE